MKTSKLIAIAAAAACCAVLSSAMAADVYAQMRRTNGQEVRGKVRWMPASKKYAVTVAQGGTAMEQQWDPSEMEQLIVVPPPGWQDIMKTASSASPDRALPALRSIIQDYKMLQYDEAAGMVAAKIYMAKNQLNEALKICEEVIKDNPRAGSSSVMAPVYWDAMISSGKTGGGRLEKMLDEAVASAPRPVSAMALVRRGDLLKKQGQARNALKDGYLRVVFLYTDQKEAVSEALFKAGETFEELHQTSYAEKMRQTLLSRYGDSAFARKLRGGN